MSTVDQDYSIQEDLGGNSRREAEIQAWLVDRLAQALKIDPAIINIKVQFDQYGVDSLAAVNLVGELEEWLGRELSPTLPYEYPTAESLARHLAEPSLKNE